MKKEYIKPTMATETIDVELPISTSLPTGEDTKIIDGDKYDFLTKERDDNSWGGLW